MFNKREGETGNTYSSKWSAAYRIQNAKYEHKPSPYKKKKKSKTTIYIV